MGDRVWNWYYIVDTSLTESSSFRELCDLSINQPRDNVRVEIFVPASNLHSSALCWPVSAGEYPLVMILCGNRIEWKTVTLYDRFE